MEFRTNKKTGQVFSVSGKKHTKLHGSPKSTGIKKVRYFRPTSEARVVPAHPKTFLDLVGSTGLAESGMHNSGMISDLGGVHTEDPDTRGAMSTNYQAGGDVEYFARYHIEWIDGKQYLIPNLTGKKKIKCLYL